MASELEEATEITHELIKENIINQTDKQHSAWINRVALSTMIMALISALGAFVSRRYIQSITHRMYRSNSGSLAYGD